jgi:predicted molibdopterin-dependent oxidoreductase YjgC
MVIMSIELTIDGKTVNGKPGQTILEVANDNDIHIPTLCTHHKLTPSGACRVCVVDVGKKDRLEAACTTPISRGMVVDTRNERVLESRRVVVQLMLDNLTIDPYKLEKDGENILLDLAKELDIAVEKGKLLTKPKEHRPEDKRNPIIIREPDKCILCGRCVSACNDLRNYGVLNFEGRGYETEITSGFGQSLLMSGCASCGECIEVCPTGSFRALDLEKVQDEIDTVLKTGTAFPASRLTNRARSKLGLAPVEEEGEKDLIIIANKTRTNKESGDEE